MAEDAQRSESGAPLYQHRPRPRAERGEPVREHPHAAAIRAHVEAHVGPITATFEELESEHVRLDVLVVGPSESRPYHTLITLGMSALPMQAPEGMEECRFTELMICLPLDWPLLDREALQTEARYWPLRWLKTLARFPHEYGTWLYWQHTVPNGEPPRPFAEDTELCALLLLDPFLAPPEFARLELDEETEIAFFALVPILADELALKLERGADELEQRLRKAGVDELLQPRRPSVC